MNDFTLRVLSAVVLAPIVLVTLVMGGWLYWGLLFVVGAIAIYEWFYLTDNLNISFLLPNRGTRFVLMFLGFVYILSFLACMYVLREVGLAFILTLLGSVWACDTFAYFVGRSVGGPKLAPKISPNKTWSGFIGGVIASGCAVSIGFYYYIDDVYMSYLAAFIFGVSLGSVEQAGDLFLSWLKRRSGMKDTGNIIPGHGGILDRIDGLIPAAICFVVTGFILYGLKA